MYRRFQSQSRAIAAPDLGIELGIAGLLLVVGWVFLAFFAVTLLDGRVPMDGRLTALGFSAACQVTAFAFLARIRRPRP